MNKSALLTLSAAGALAATSVAAAAYWGVFDQAPTASRNTPGSGRFNAAVKLMEYDVNKDGKLTRIEVDAALNEEFRTVDANGDGRLDAAEIQRHIDRRQAERRARYDAWRAKALAQGLDPRRPPADINSRDNVDTLKYGDWNLDGFITPDEFGGRTRAAFMKADRNGDGVITQDELRPRPASRTAR